MRQTLTPWCTNYCHSSGIPWMSVWMITYRKTLCLGVFYLIGAYLSKLITKAALELDAQPQSNCGISVTQQTDSNWEQPRGNTCKLKAPMDPCPLINFLYHGKKNPKNTKKQQKGELCKNNGCWVPANTKWRHAFNRWHSKSSVQKGNDPVLWMACNTLFKW